MVAELLDAFDDLQVVVVFTTRLRADAEFPPWMMAIVALGRVDLVEGCMS